MSNLSFSTASQHLMHNVIIVVSVFVVPIVFQQSSAIMSILIAMIWIFQNANNFGPSIAKLTDTALCLSDSFLLHYKSTKNMIWHTLQINLFQLINKREFTAKFAIIIHDFFSLILQTVSFY